MFEPRYIRKMVISGSMVEVYEYLISSEKMYRAFLEKNERNQNVVISEQDTSKFQEVGILQSLEALEKEWKANSSVLSDVDF